MELNAIAQRIRTTLTANFAHLFSFTEMENLLARGQEFLRSDEIEAALQSGQLKVWAAPCENCYEYMEAELDGKGSLFPQDCHKAVAKQIIVAMAE